MPETLVSYPRISVVYGEVLNHGGLPGLFEAVMISVLTLTTFWLWSQVTRGEADTSLT